MSTAEQNNVTQAQKAWELIRLPFEKKVDHTKNQIRQFYEMFDGKVYVCFSGGKDSAALLHLVRSIYPEVLAVHVNTGVEYPEVTQNVMQTANVKVLPCTLRFDQIIEKYGYPVVSKQQASYIEAYRNSKSPRTRALRWNGLNGQFKIAEKWKFLVDAPFKISSKCCSILKKEPLIKFEKQTGMRPFIGTKASDSQKRMYNFRKHGCNNYATALKEKSMPLSPWTDEDVWQYIKTHNIPVPTCYNYMPSTGCMYCLFGVQYHGVSQLEFLRIHHPKIYNYAVDKLGLLGVAEYVLMGEKIYSRQKIRNKKGK
jgi:3'-phosphoadenosine 5'-phosphosulfate sulfotransferase (PAPS reductase)/FAD synthetase